MMEPSLKHVLSFGVSVAVHLGAFGWAFPLEVIQTIPTHLANSMSTAWGFEVNRRLV